MKSAGMVAAAALALVGFGAVGDTAGATATPTSYYVSLGDSYAAGYQWPGAPTNAYLHGYAYQLTKLLATKQHPMTLENFGCGGATTTSFTSVNGCPHSRADRPPYPGKTQLQAALDFTAAHAGHVGLVTISIGDNDFIHCMGAPDPASCIAAAMPTMKANILTAVAKLRAAVGQTVPILAITYPDVELGAWLKGSAGRSLASASVQSFALVINPGLRAAYATQGVGLEDVTRATGSYIPWSRTTILKPYGTVPQAVAKECTLTWFCANGSIHPRTIGYRLIAQLLEDAYLKLAR